ncbi:unnamed protein product [Urochloa humidicola]
MYTIKHASIQHRYTVSIEHRNMYILNKLIIGLCYIPHRCPSPTHPSLPNFIQEVSINAKENVSADGVVPVANLIQPVPSLKCYLVLEDTALCCMHHQGE